MNLKVAALTATTVAVAAMLPSMADSNVHTVEAEQTAKTKIGYVKTDTLQMYNSPNGTDSVIDNITRNTPVTILETTNEWYKVHIHNKTGYVKKDAISLTKPQKDQYIVNADALSVRSEPNTQSEIITVLPNGKFVTVQEEQEGWYKITYNGTSGYVKKEFLSNADQPLVKGITVQGGNSYYVATPTLKVRSGAGTNTAIIGSLQNGAQVQVVESVGTWYKIRYGSGYGYVAQHYVVPGQQQQQPKQQATPSIPAVFKYPAQGKISSEFDVRWGEMHYGVDIAATGNVPIQAAASGTVVKSYYSTSYGNVVFVAHRINGNLYTTVYAHMKSRAVKAGDTVQTGQLLGYMGNTGHSFGQHLHFELHNGEWNFEKTNAVNPLPFLVR